MSGKCVSSPAFARPRLPPYAPEWSTNRVRVKTFYRLSPTSSMRGIRNRATWSGAARGLKYHLPHAENKNWLQCRRGKDSPPPSLSRGRDARSFTIFFCKCRGNTRLARTSSTRDRGERQSNDARERRERIVGLVSTRDHRHQRFTPSILVFSPRAIRERPSSPVTIVSASRTCKTEGRARDTSR